MPNPTTPQQGAATGAAPSAPLSAAGSPPPDETLARQDLLKYPSPMDLARELLIPDAAAVRLLTYAEIQHMDEMASEKRTSLLIGVGIGALSAVALGGAAFGVNYLLTKRKEEHAKKVEAETMARLSQQGLLGTGAAPAGLLPAASPEEEDEEDEEEDEDDSEEEEEPSFAAPPPSLPSYAAPGPLRPVSSLRSTVR